MAFGSCSLRDRRSSCWPSTALGDVYKNTAITDLNEITKVGIYAIRNLAAESITNKPSSTASACTIFVSSKDIRDHTEQILILTERKGMWSRIKEDGIWGNWVTIISE